MKRLIPFLLIAACARDTVITSGTPSAQDDSITLADLPVKMDPPTLATFAQEIDHPYQPSASLGTFAQRYWYSTQFADDENSPVLFYLCGEWTCSQYDAMVMSDAAKSLHASIVALEHRYYGKSLPYADLTREHMQYLTIHNALEDAAAFQRFATGNLPLKGKWIAIGGSYPGMLAAYYRLKHPELVVGAWASSAPVKVQLSFWGYDAIAAKALGPVCTLLVRQSLARAGEVFDDKEALNKLIDQLGWNGWMPESKTRFVDIFTWTAAGDAQYGQTEGLCAALQQYATDPLQGFVRYMNPPLAEDDAPAAATGPTSSTNEEDPNRPTIPFMPMQRPATDNFRGAEWYYQVCTEVGFFQVHNPDRTSSIMSDDVTEEASKADCLQWVGSLPDIDVTLERYYNPIARGEASNILFVNSALDPWSALSFVDQSTAPAGVTTYVVQGGSHCSDLGGLRPNDLLGKFEAHKLFHDLAKTWLAQ